MPAIRGERVTLAPLDIYLAPEHHARGLGTDAIVAMCNHLMEARMNNLLRSYT